MKSVQNLIIGCGSVGLSLLGDFASDPESALALEASARVGGSPFLVARLYPGETFSANTFARLGTLPALEIWWERSWTSATAVDWKNQDWAFVLPQWQVYFGELTEVELREQTTAVAKPFVKLETPVSQISCVEGVWQAHSGDQVFTGENLHWTLGLKSFQACFGKKEAEEYLAKNLRFSEAARESEGVFAAEYARQGATETGESRFLGIPVRHNGKLFLSFARTTASRIETFTYLTSDLLKNPKEISSFEKALKRTLKHVLSLTSELTEPNLGVLPEARGIEMTSPWMLASQPTQKIFFYDSSYVRSPSAQLAPSENFSSPTL